MVLIGDFAQGKPTVLSKGENEFSFVLTTSLFERLWKFPPLADYRSFLDVQYRMTPYLSGFPREHIYNESGLVDAEEVKGKTKIQQQLDGLFKDLKKQGVWNGKPRMGIDCFGTSKLDENGSTFNEEEAQMVVLLVPYLTTTAKIDPDLILVMSPYKAQKNLIRKKLQTSTDSRPTQVKVKIAHRILGDERNIVILSLARAVKGEPNNLSFIWEREPFTVQITWAKDFLIVLANFKALSEVIKTRAPADNMVLSKKCRLFREFIEDCLKKQDVMSADDFRLAMFGGDVDKPEFKKGNKGSKQAQSSGRGSGRGRGRGGRGGK